MVQGLLDLCDRGPAVHRLPHLLGEFLCGMERRQAGKTNQCANFCVLQAVWDDLPGEKSLLNFQKLFVVTFHPTAPSYSPSSSAHCLSSCWESLPFSSFPGSSLAPGQLGWSFSFVCPIPLPPEVAKGTTALPEKS